MLTHCCRVTIWIVPSLRCAFPVYDITPLDFGLLFSWVGVEFWAGLDMAKQVRIFWYNPIDLFKNNPFWLVTWLTRKPDWSDPTRPFCHVYQRWVNWDWGVILIKYLLILLYLICYVLYYNLLFFTCYLHFFFLF